MDKEVKHKVTEPNSSDVIKRLIDELRNTNRILDEVRRELAGYQDAGLMTTVGAVKLVIKKAKLVEDISYMLRRCKDPDKAQQLLIDVERLIEGAE